MLLFPCVSVSLSTTVYADASVTLTTISQPLEPYIEGGLRQFVGFDQPLTLDASFSFDPDRSPDPTYYIWSCQVSISQLEQLACN